MLRSLVLASTASWRGDLLRQLGLPFVQADPQLDEQPWKQRGLPPRELVTELARAKARALAASYPDALLLAADQVAVFEGTVLGKPGNAERAVEQLLLLSGRSHELVTGVALHDARSGRDHTTVVVRTLTMRSLSSAAAEEYVRRDCPLQCAGSYRIEALGIALFEHIDGDSSGVVGLPLMAVTGLLRDAGVGLLAG